MHVEDFKKPDTLALDNGAAKAVGAEQSGLLVLWYTSILQEAEQVAALPSRARIIATQSSDTHTPALNSSTADGMDKALAMKEKDNSTGDDASG